MEKVFRFVVGEETHSRISAVMHENSAYADGYLKAYAAVEGIVEKTKEYNDKEDIRGFDGGTELYNYHNNIIVFSANRGCGKTSAMLTFSKSLQGRAKQGSNQTRQPLQDALEKCLDASGYIVLPPIDPSTLDKQHDVLSVILSRIFKYASDYWERNGRQSERLREKNELLENLRRCYMGVSSLSEETAKNREWTLEELSQFGDSSALKKTMFDMIKCFIRLMRGSEKATHLVIQIDDADMNFQCLYDIMERIRNYLMIPNVIILFAADIDLLRQLIYNKFWNDLEKKNDKSVLQLTEQYILKCFPPKHRIYLPSIEESLQGTSNGLYIRIHGDKQLIDNLGVCRNYCSNPTSCNNQDPKSDAFICNGKSKGCPLEDTLLRLIFKKTGFFFTKHSDYNYILPRTQRGIVQLLAILNDMPTIPHLEKFDDHPYNGNIDYHEDAFLFYPSYVYEGDYDKYQRALEQWKRNVDTFYQYFINEWLQANLTAESQDFIRRLANCRLDDKNGYVYNFIKQKLKVYDSKEASDSIAGAAFVDICKMLNKYQKYADERIEFAVRTYYAILTMQIVLNDLINYRVKNNKYLSDSNCLCKFDDLYKLYGSRIIPLCNAKDSIDYNNQTPYLINKSENGIFKYYTEWTYENRTKAQKCDWRVSFLSSLLSADYHKVIMKNENKTNYDVPYESHYNVFSPIVNCLYMNHEQQYSATEIAISGKTELKVRNPKKFNLRIFQDVCMSIITNVDCLFDFEKAFGHTEYIDEHIGDNKNSPDTIQDTTIDNPLSFLTFVYRQMINYSPFVYKKKGKNDVAEKLNNEMLVVLTSAMPKSKPDVPNTIINKLLAGIQYTGDVLHWNTNNEPKSIILCS